MRLITQLIAAVALTMSAHAADIARMDQVMASETADHAFMGAVLVAKDGQLLLDKGYGEANLEWGIANTPTTRFRINSLAKQFTAAAILLLQDRGKLKLNDPVQAWWPDAPPAWDKVTLENLLTQSSGIPDYTDAPDFGTTMKLKRTIQQSLAFVRDKPLDFTPGEKFSYSNSNYMLLGAIVEKAAGMPYAQFMQEAIFTPLDMKDSGYDDGAAVVARRASGYAHKAKIVNATFIDVSAQHGAGALYSTTHDLLKWEQGLLGGKLLSPASLKTMLAPAHPASGPATPYKSSYAMGVYVGTDIDGRREISHTGSGPGFVSIMNAYPDDKLYVIVLGNIDSTPFGDIAAKLTDIAFGNTVVLPAERKEIAIDTGKLARFTGRYQLRPGFVIEIIQEGDHLIALPAANPRIALSAQGTASFFARSPDLQVDFQGKGAHPTGLVWRINGEILSAPRLP
jgi:CubicO group peptidase (beta-lactamase class C family)